MFVDGRDGDDDDGDVTGMGTETAASRGTELVKE